MRAIALVPLILVVAACGKGTNSGNGGSASAGAGADQAALDAAYRMKAGRYRSTLSIQKISGAGLPAQVAQMMPRQHNFEYCITPEMAAGGIEALKRQMAEGKCQYERFNASAGKVESAFVCDTGGGMTMRSTSKGTYTETGSEAAVVADMTMPGGKAMHIEETVKAERIGDCAN